MSAVQTDKNTSQWDDAPQWFREAIAVEPQSQYFDDGPTRLHYLSWNTQDSDKPVLVFLHGFRGHARWWSFIAPFFTERYRVYALDFSGMGDSDHRPAYTINSHASDLLNLIAHIDSGPIAVVGHSYGGHAALRAASLQQAAIKNIVAVDSYMLFADETYEGEIIEHRQRIYKSLAEGMARFRLLPPQALGEAYVLRFIASHSLKKMPQGGWSWKFDANFDMNNFMVLDGAELLPKVLCPVDYILADNSAVMSRYMVDKIRAHLSNPGRLVVVPEGSHHLMVSHPVASICTLQALL